MRQLRNLILLYIYCFFSVFFISVNTGFVLASLSAVVVFGSSYYFCRRTYSLVICTVYMLCGFGVVPCLCFFPVLCCELLTHKLRLPLLLGAIVYLTHFRTLPLPLAALIAFGCALALLLQKQTEEYESLDTLYKKTTDDTTELTLLLKEKNKSLLEKQDYEIYAATLRERNRIAREIHDNVGHMLSRSILMVGALRAVNTEDHLMEPLENLETTLTQAMDSVRQSVHDLHDESINLKEALEKLLREFTFCPATLHYDMDYHIPREVKYCFISVIKEALVNVSRHSNATELTLTLREHPGFWQLSVLDNGSTRGEIAQSGIGLQNIKERILSLDGQIEITKNQGFHIFATVPKSHFQKPDDYGTDTEKREQL